MSRKEDKSGFTPKYSSQVILNFGDHTSDAPALLRKKWINQGNDPAKCFVLVVLPEDNLSVHDSKFLPLSLLDGKSRLYIIGHCAAGNEGLLSKSNHLFSNPTIARFLKIHLNKDLFKASDKIPLKISLIACEAGIGANREDFFSSAAANLQQLLMRENILTHILARISLVTVSDHKDTLGKKLTVKLAILDDNREDYLDSECQHQQFGSKVTFRFEESKGSLVQVAEDSYAENWKKKALISLNQNIQSTSIHINKVYLELLRDQIEKLSPMRGLTALDDVVNKNIFVEESSGFFKFFKKSALKKNLTTLCENGKEVMHDKYSFSTRYSQSE